MGTRTLLQIVMAAAIAAAPMPTLAQTLSSSQGPLQVQRVVSGIGPAWGLAFLPDGAMLITRTGGALLHVAGGASQNVAGVPDVYSGGQGGLLDVMVPRDFADSREIFLSYSARQSGGAGTTLAVGRLSDDGSRLEAVRQIFQMAPGSSGGRHFGSRIVEAPDGRIFLTIGERGDRPAAQDRSNHNGTVVRLNRDGSVPSDNPFVDQDGIQPEIWSYGHRNPQGAALDASGQLWVHEHGARGGDEVNRVQRGANYGWPVISYGRHYSGGQIGEGTSKPGMEQPVHYWDPSIAPSGLAIHSGAMFPDWEGDFFVGSLKFGFIERIDGATMEPAERIEGPQTGRVRDVVEGPDGAIWFISETNGAVYRLTPAG